MPLRPSLHTRATAWYILADKGHRPPARNAHLRSAGLSHIATAGFALTPGVVRGAGARSRG
jgi:hypothetical protein